MRSFFTTINWVTTATIASPALLARARIASICVGARRLAMTRGLLQAFVDVATLILNFPARCFSVTRLAHTLVAAGLILANGVRSADVW